MHSTKIFGNYASLGPGTFHLQITTKNRRMEVLFILEKKCLVMWDLRTKLHTDNLECLENSNLTYVVFEISIKFVYSR
jgi:hypothetical protein